MYDVEKKSYFDMQVEQKKAYMEWIAKEKGNTEVKKEMTSRCSMKKVFILFKEMQKMKIDGVVGELGFSPLLGMKNRAIHREVCRELATNFDLESSMMKYNEHKISLMVEDVEAVLGSKNEAVNLEGVLRKYNGKELALKYNINMNVKYQQLEEEILSGHFEEEELKAWILLYIVGVFLCPNANIVASLEHMKLLCSAGMKGKLNWCKFVYDRLIDGVRKFKDRACKFLTGCIVILEVIFFKWMFH